MKKIKNLEMFVESIRRAELYENPRCFIKGIIVVLLYLDYDIDWVLDDLSNYLWSYYENSK